MLILFFILRKKQPLKSRGWYPPVLLLSMILQSSLLLVSQWVNQPYLPISKIGLYGSAIIFALPFTVVVVYLLCLQVIRFMLITNLNRMKLVVWNGNIAVMSEKKYLLHRMLTSDITFVISTIVVLVVQLLLGTLFTVLLQTKVMTELIAQLIMVAQSIAIMFVFIVITMAVMLWGIYVEGKERGFKNFLSPSRDPLLFRVDCIILLLLIPVTIATVTFQVLQTLPGIMMVPNRFLPIVVCTRVCLLFTGILLSLLSGGTCMIAIIYKKFFVRKTITNRYSTSLVEMLRGRDTGLEEFQEYCKGEWCSENIMAYIDIQKYHGCTNNQERFESATKIYTTYLVSGAVAEVNTARAIREQIQAHLQKGEDDSLADMFVDFERELVLNMTDVFSRFSQTAEYKRMAEQQAIQRKEMAKHNFV